VADVDGAAQRPRPLAEREAQRLELALNVCADHDPAAAAARRLVLAREAEPLRLRTHAGAAEDAPAAVERNAAVAGDADRAGRADALQLRRSSLTVCQLDAGAEAGQLSLGDARISAGDDPLA